MHIMYYRTSSPNNAVTKQLTYIDGNEITRVKDTVDLLNPVLEVDYRENLLSCNYMWIEEYKRYYFVSVEQMTGGRLRINGNVDVLMTYKNEIKKLNAWIRIGESNPFIADTRKTQIQYPIIYARKINGIKFEQPHYILLANGRG